MKPISEATLQMLDKVPPLRGAVADLLHSLHDETINTTALAKKIGHDPMLSARVLKVVNSPFYGVAGRVSSLPEAVMVLGFSNIRSLALAASLAGGFPLAAHGEADPRRVWRHSFCCALTAQALAGPTRIDEDTAFSAGLLHDIGRIALFVAAPDKCAAAIELHRQQGGCVTAAEEAIFGMSHAALGARLLTRWRLPAALVRAVEFHHRPDMEPTGRLTDLVSVADDFAHALEQAKLEWILDSERPNGAFIRLGLTRTQGRERLAAVPQQLDALGAILN
ncbi:MAG: HDOD domain-containing protein [Rhodocyclales bacterium]|nr:HDOD domain-containing protein [Rhodocyclales bacterium]